MSADRSISADDQLPTEDSPELLNATLYANDGNMGESISDFEVKSVLGRGTFGKVFLVQKKDGAVFAMKAMSKETLLEKDCVQSTLLEKEILLKANHPFLVGMSYVFQTQMKRMP